MAKLIVVEGLDGSGKATQTSMLNEKLKALGKKVRMIDFPDYSSEGSKLVQMYLNGDLGSRADDTNAFAASTFFACDRYISYVTGWKKDYLDENTIILANRYTTANAYHQLSKAPRKSWDEFLDWLWDFEFVKLGLPSPDMIILLDMPEKVSAGLVKSRSKETGRKIDIHEKDDGYLKRCRTAAHYVAKKCGWNVIPCVTGNRDIPDSVEEISERVFAEVRKRFPDL